MKALSAVILVGLSLLSFSAHADLTIKNYKADKAAGGQVWQEVTMYVMGVGVGYVYANVALSMDKKAMLYCQPEHLQLDANNYLEMLDKELKLMDLPPDHTIEFLLLEGLQKTFPCK